MSKRTDIAINMHKSFGESTEHWLKILYRLEEAGYQVVKTSETAEYQGLRNAEG